MRQPTVDLKISKNSKIDDQSQNFGQLAEKILSSLEFKQQIEFLWLLATPDGKPFPELKLLSSSDLLSSQVAANLTEQQFLEIYESQMDGFLKIFSHCISEDKISELVSVFKIFIEEKKESSIIKFAFLFYILGVDCFKHMVEKEKAENYFFFKSKTIQGFMLNFGKSEVLQNLVKDHQRGRIKDWRNNKGESIGHMAVLRYDIDLLKQVLVFLPEQMDIEDLSGYTPIDIATYYKSLDLLKLMIQYPIVAYWRGSNKESLFHRLCSWEDAFQRMQELEFFFAYFREYYPELFKISGLLEVEHEVKDKQGKVHLECHLVSYLPVKFFDDPSKLKLISLYKKYDPEWVNDEKTNEAINLLHYSAARGLTTILANFKKNTPNLLGTKKYLGKSILTYAIEFGQTSSIEWIFENCSDKFNSEYKENNRNLIQIAAYYGQISVLEFFHQRDELEKEAKEKIFKPSSILPVEYLGIGFYYFKILEWFGENLSNWKTCPENKENLLHFCAVPWWPYLPTGEKEEIQLGQRILVMVYLFQHLPNSFWTGKDQNGRTPLEVALSNLSDQPNSVHYFCLYSLVCGKFSEEMIAENEHLGQLKSSIVSILKPQAYLAMAENLLFPREIINLIFNYWADTPMKIISSFFLNQYYSLPPLLGDLAKPPINRFYVEKQMAIVLDYQYGRCDEASKKLVGLAEQWKARTARIAKKDLKDSHCRGSHVSNMRIYSKL